MITTKVSEALPEEIKAALDLGLLSQVVIFCDVCGLEMATDMIGDTAEARFEGARAYLRSHRGWVSADGQDLCPFCTAGIRVCHESSHWSCEHELWCWDETTGFGVHPDDQNKFAEALALAMGEAS